MRPNGQPDDAAQAIKPTNQIARVRQRKLEGEEAAVSPAILFGRRMARLGSALLADREVHTAKTSRIILKLRQIEWSKQSRTIVEELELRLRSASQRLKNAAGEGRVDCFQMYSGGCIVPARSSSITMRYSHQSTERTWETSSRCAYFRLVPAGWQ